jgi:hypothetical protein
MGPAIYIGLQQRERIDGSPFLAGRVDRDLALAAGSRVELRRSGADFVLVVIAPTERWQPSRAERARVEAANCAAQCTRSDLRDAGGEPWHP